MASLNRLCFTKIWNNHKTVCEKIHANIHEKAASALCMPKQLNHIQQKSIPCFYVFIFIFTMKILKRVK